MGGRVLLHRRARRADKPGLAMGDKGLGCIRRAQRCTGSARALRVGEYADDNIVPIAHGTRKVGFHGKAVEGGTHAAQQAHRKPAACVKQPLQAWAQLL